MAKTLLGRELEWVRPDKGSSQNHKIYLKFARPRYEHAVDVNIDALEIRGCIWELEKAISCEACHAKGGHTDMQREQGLCEINFSEPTPKHRRNVYYFNYGDLMRAMYYYFPTMD